MNLSKLSHVDINARAKKNLGTFATTHMQPEAEKLYTHYSSLNAVDFCAYPELEEILEQCGQFILKLCHPPVGQDYGFFSTSGSSEAIIMSVFFLKHAWALKHGNKTMPNIVIGPHTHVAWHKAATLLDIEVRVAPLDEHHFTMDFSKLDDYINENTIGVCATLGATSTCRFDAVKALNNALKQYYQRTKHFIPIHVDAASGGFIAPFYYKDLEWDFRLEHVQAINISSHKYGLIYPGLAWLCYKDSLLTQALAHEHHYLGKPITRYQLQFSHSAAPLVAQFYMIENFGMHGYEKIIKSLFSLCERLKSDMLQIDGIKILNPQQWPSIPGIIFAIEHPNKSLNHLASFLAKKGWNLPTFALPAPIPNKLGARIVIRNGYDQNHLDAIVDEIKAYFSVNYKPEA